MKVFFPLKYLVTSPKCICDFNTRNWGHSSVANRKIAIPLYPVLFFPSFACYVLSSRNFPISLVDVPNHLILFLPVFFFSLPFRGVIISLKKSLPQLHHDRLNTRPRPILFARRKISYSKLELQDFKEPIK